MLGDLGAQVMDELMDDEFDTFTHGIKSTYTNGCRGPLCRKAERDTCAKRYRERMGRLGRPVREYAPRETAYPEEWLQSVIDWHRAERKKMIMSHSWKEYYKINQMQMPERDLVTAG